MFFSLKWRILAAAREREEPFKNHWEQIGNALLAGTKVWLLLKLGQKHPNVFKGCGPQAKYSQLRKHNTTLQIFNTLLWDTVS